MTMKFERSTISSKQNVAELLYTSTLLQTNRTFIREDARLTATDLKLYLSSRYGIQISREDCHHLLIEELAGGGQREGRRAGNNNSSSNRSVVYSNGTIGQKEEEKNEVVVEEEEEEEELDLVQWTSLLLLPVLKEVLENENQEQAKEDLEDYENQSCHMGDVEEAAVGDTDESSERRSPPKKHLQQSVYGRTTREEEEEETTVDVVMAVLRIILQEANIEYGSPMNEETLQKVFVVFTKLADGDNRHDETNLYDELIEDMLQQAATEGETACVWDRSTFLRALTSDTEIYDTKRQTMYTTHYEDALAITAEANATSRIHTNDSLHVNDSILQVEKGHMEKEEEAPEETIDTADTQQSHPLHRTWTAPHVDSAVDTSANFTWQLIAWMVFGAYFFAYLFDGIYPETGWLPTMNCTEPIGDTNSTTGEVGDNAVETLEYFGCQVVESILNWLEVFIKLGLLGSFFLFIVSLGNSIYLYSQQLHKHHQTANTIRKFRLESLGQFTVGIAMNIFASYIAFFFRNNENYALSSFPEGVNAVAASVTPILGTVLLFIQLLQVCRFFWTPDAVTAGVDGKSCSAKLTLSNPLRAERHLKRACQYKVNKMIQNAMLCHCNPGKLHGFYDNLQVSEEEAVDDIHGSHTSFDDDGIPKQVVATIEGLDRNRSASSDAVIRYEIPSQDSEKVGGIIWTWKKLRNRTAFNEEGLWLHPRLLSANILQFVVVIGFLVATLYLSDYIDNEITDETLERLHLTQQE